jgi:flagellar biosynthesis protein FlhG
MPQNRGPILFAVGSGKGGVGKSFVSSNLAVQYAQAGLRVALLDMDFGAANLHTIFGISRSKGWGDYFLDEKKDLKDYLTPTSIDRLSVILGSGFTAQLASLDEEKKK